jgi:hypothetical protein
MEQRIYSNEELKRRKCDLLSQFIYQCYEEKKGFNSRISEVMIWDEWAIIGKSSSESKAREHVVPLCYLNKLSLDMFKNNASLKDVSNIWFHNYFIALITSEEMKKLNSIQGLKFGMPDKWEVGCDPRERLWKANIILDTDNIMSLTA